jgi:putrescine transport system substrate-binding protein
MEKMKPEVSANKTIFIEPAVAAKMVKPGKFTNEGREAMASAFTTFKKGK